jgi:hypothetical protein
MPDVEVVSDVIPAVFKPESRQSKENLDPG